MTRRHRGVLRGLCITVGRRSDSFQTPHIPAHCKYAVVIQLDRPGSSCRWDIKLSRVRMMLLP